MTSTRFRLAFGVLVLAVSAIVRAESPPGPAIGSFGLDLGGGDTTVRPGADFYRYAGGHWLQSTVLPPDHTRWGAFDALGAQAEDDVHAILESAAANRARAGAAERQIGDFYASFLDTRAIDAAGLAPARAGLGAIAAARTHTDIARLMARPALGLPAPIDFAISVDRKDPDRYAVIVSSGGLGLPDRDYYLRDDGSFPALREQYRAHVGRLLALAGAHDAEAASARIVALEAAIARLHWTRAERRDRERTYNPHSRASLRAFAPHYPWDAALVDAGLGTVSRVIVAEASAIEPLAALFRATPVTTWREYLLYHYLAGHAATLPAALDAEVFDFYGRTLGGQPEQRARWKRAVEATNASLGEAVGRLYVAAHFSPASRAAMQALVEHLRRAFAVRLASLAWMTPATRAAAAEKLATFRPKIGYPDHWRDYSAVKVRRGDAFGNGVRATVAEWQRRVARLDQPTDRDEWGVPPQTVNAFYNATFNEIVFPAAILQPPFFDAAADAAVNYGAIGGVIGHEMGHGFDDQGAKSDARGVLRTWWAEGDTVAFRALGDRLAAQYSGYEPLPGMHIDGRLTLGENIGDLTGITVALDAYRLSLDGLPAPILEGLGGEQRFFLGWAQVWRVLFREAALRNRLLTDPHSPGEYRVNAVLRNVDAWYAAFDVAPDDALYLPPESRVRIW